MHLLFALSMASAPTPHASAPGFDADGREEGEYMLGYLSSCEEVPLIVPVCGVPVCGVSPGTMVIGLFLPQNSVHLPICPVQASRGSASVRE